MSTEQDRFDAMSDDALVQHLQAAASARREQLAIGERAGQLGTPQWVAETWQEGGLAGRTVGYSAAGDSRRAAMLALARRMESS